MTAPRVDQVNVVVGDVQAVMEFLAALGVDLPAGPPGWEAWRPHHGTVPAGQPFDLDMDSSVFAAQWGGLPPSFTGAVITVRVDERAEVDRLHELAASAGGRSLKAPYDAFWGARYAVLEAPGSAMVGIMSAADDAHRTEPPDLSSLS